MAVRSELPRVSLAGADQQSRLNACHAFLAAHAALEPILNRELEAAYGLPLRGFDVLVQLHAMPHNRLSMTELADAVLLSKSGLTRLVDRIEEAGLVQRAPAPGDRRSLLIVLTPGGEKMLKRRSTRTASDAILLRISGTTTRPPLKLRSVASPPPHAITSL